MNCCLLYNLQKEPRFYHEWDKTLANNENINAASKAVGSGASGTD